MKIFYLSIVMFLLVLNCCMGQDNFTIAFSQNKTFQVKEITQETEAIHSDYSTKITLNKKVTQSREMEGLEMVKSILEKENSKIFKSGIFSREFKGQSQHSDEVQGEMLIIMSQFISSILELQ